MSILKEIRRNDCVDANQIVGLFNEISKNGHVLILKSDGPREKNVYSCIISFPDKPMNSIRRDGDNLLETVYEAVSEYQI